MNLPILFALLSQVDACAIERIGKHDPAVLREPPTFECTIIWQDDEHMRAYYPEHLWPAYMGLTIVDDDYHVFHGVVVNKFQWSERINSWQPNRNAKLAIPVRLSGHVHQMGRQWFFFAREIERVNKKDENAPKSTDHTPEIIELFKE